MTAEQLVLFCKSYDRDLYRAKRLADSIDRFNTDHLAFYMSVPQKDLSLFQNVLADNGCTLITDEEVISKTCGEYGEIPGYFSSYLIQQLVKLEFWRMGDFKNYAWVDSDTYFIKPFRRSDFMCDPDVPYTIRQVFDPVEKREKWKNAPAKERERRINDRMEHIATFRSLFGGNCDNYDFFGSTPIVWSCKVLASFHEKYLVQRGQSVFRLLADYPCETSLYGYYLQTCQCIPIHPKPHMFKNYDYLDEFMEAEKMGENEYTLSKKYIGVCFQSNWTYFKRKKTLSERLNNRKDEFKYFISKLTGHH